jgi:hypothetical protein
MKLENPLHILEKYSNIKLLENLSSESRVVSLEMMEGPTDGHEAANSLLSVLQMRLKIRRSS